jgi:hypothetical protein
MGRRLSHGTGRIITMANRYPERPALADRNYGRSGGSRSPSNGEGDPLAELARLIGQSDFTMGRANLPVQSQARQRDPYDRQHHDRQQRQIQHEPEEPAPELDDGPPPGPPSWMQRVARQEPAAQPQPDRVSAVHPLHRYAAPNAAPEPEYDETPAYEMAGEERGLSRYDDALYGELESGAQDRQQDQAYAEDSFDYQDEYAEPEPAEEPKRRRGMIKVFAVLALAVFGVGGAYAYRTYAGTARNTEPPVIRADASPTKIIPVPAESGTKLPDRMVSGDGTEKIVSREEAPVDINAKSAPRVVFPTPSQGGFPPGTASAVPTVPPAVSAANGTLPNSEPRKIKTLSVRGDQPDAAAPQTAPQALVAPPAKPAANAKTAAVRTPPSVANANANAPLSLAPQPTQPAAEPQTRVAATSPTQPAPSAGGAAGGYLVQVSSQRSESDAQASFKALQTKFPAVLGSQSPVIRRADLGDKGIYYRAMVGPFNSPDEASQFCGNLKSAGGQCVVQRN